MLNRMRPTSSEMLNRMRTTCMNCFGSGSGVDTDDGGSSVQVSTSMNEDLENGTSDEYLWSSSLQRYFSGDYDIAGTFLSPTREVYGQVEAGPNGAFVGIYDGHNGDQTARFLYRNLFTYMMKSVARSGGTISETVLTDVIERTEDICLNSMRVICSEQPAGAVDGSSYATVGSSCLIGLIYDKKLYVANLGDSRAVMYSMDASSQSRVDQLTPEDSLRMKEVKKQMLELHPDDAQDIVRNNLVKGKVVTTKSIGDLYLKDTEYSNIPEMHQRFRLWTPLKRPVLSAEPFISTVALDETNKFVIFASYSVWRFLSNERAAEIVATKPRKDIAKRLIGEAVAEAGRRNKPPYTYEFIKALDRFARIDCQMKDMLAAVIYLDEDGSLGVKRGTGYSSVKAFVDIKHNSSFSVLTRGVTA